MWAIHGMMAIPGDPQVQVSSPTGTNKGKFINFKAVTEGRKQGQDATYQYWHCAMWVPEDKVDYWVDQLKPGHVFIIEHAYCTSYPVQDGKYHNTLVRLEHQKVKRLQKAMWAKE